MGKDLIEKGSCALNERVIHKYELTHENSELFLTFMLSNGFNLENCDNILELMQPVSSSISQHLKNYKQFLLSELVRYSELQSYDIKGACGYIEYEEGIIVPKSIEADEYFRDRQGRFHNKQIPRYIYPSISDFDSVIGYYDWYTKLKEDDKLTKILGIDMKLLPDFSIEKLRQIISTLSFSFKNNYFGFITAKDDEKLSQKIKIFTYILDELNKESSQEHIMVHDTLSSQNKEFYLIKSH